MAITDNGGDLFSGFSWPFSGGADATVGSGLTTQYPYGEGDPYVPGTYNPWAGMESTELEEIQSEVDIFWEDLEHGVNPETGESYWADIEGGYEEYAHFFDPYEDWYGKRAEWLIDQAAGDIADDTLIWDLLQEQALGQYELGVTQAGELLDFQTGQLGTAWDLQRAGYLSELTGLQTLWGLSEDEIARRRTEAGTMWDLTETSLERQIGEAGTLFDLKAAELDRLGIAAGDLWSLSAANLEALGIDAADIWQIERADIVRRQGETYGLYGIEQQMLTGQKVGAQDIWNITAADIARRKVEAGTMWGMEAAGLQQAWGLQAAGLRDVWGTEKEQLGYGAQLGIEQAQKGEANAILAMGFATGPTGLGGAERRMREQYGMQLTAGEEALARGLTMGEMQLTNQLTIGTERLVQTQAGLQAELNMGQEQLENTLETLDAKLSISQAEYDSAVAELASDLNMGEVQLNNLLDSYNRDIEAGELKLDQDLEALAAQGLIDDEQLIQLQAGLNDQIDWGAANLSNVLAGLTAEEAQGLARYNIDVANVNQQIAEGELTLDQAISSGLLTYDQAIASGLITYEDAIEMGAAEYEIGIGDIYDTLQKDIWDTIGTWRSEQKSILASILAGDPWAEAPVGQKGDTVIPEDVPEYDDLGDLENLNINLSDIRLKEDINYIGTSPSGLNIYRFKYKDQDGIYEGVMSHEIPSNAVIKGPDGYDRVYYSMIDVNFKRIK